MTRLEIELRALLRRSGLLPLLSRVRQRLGGASRDYEEPFRRALLGSLRPGDQVGDVGANVGYYTRLLAEGVGAEGAVRAFEPAPHCLERLEVETRDLSNVRIEPIALGDSDASMAMQLRGEAETGAHSLVGEKGAIGPTTQVTVVRGDDFRARREAPVPQVVKIDVEGFEEEVLLGMQETLRDPACRAVFCEIHFAILESRGKRFAPRDIEQRMKAWGFVTTRWLDRSHLMALKAGAPAAGTG